LFIDTVRYASGLLRRFAPRNDRHCERSEAIQMNQSRCSGLLRRSAPRNDIVVLFIASLLFFLITPSYPQTVPYITDMAGEDGIEKSEMDERDGGDNRLRLIGTFKLFNPDTVPFYIWITFENGGKFKHSKYRDDYPAVRLVDLELHYKDALSRPMVKKFPNRADFAPRVKKRFGGSWLGGGRSSSGKKASRSRRGVVEDVDDVDDIGDVGSEATEGRNGRDSRGASEITFWKEDAQAYYEMELWGALYAPDVKSAVVAGNYVENIKFEIEPVR